MKPATVCPEVVVIVDVDRVRGRRWLEVADVILTGRAVSPPRWMDEALRTFPGAAIAAVARSDGGSLLGLRDGRLVVARAPAVPLAAFLHTWLAHGESVEALDGTVLRLGRAVRIRVGRWDEGDEAAHLRCLDVREPFVDP